MPMPYCTPADQAPPTYQCPCHSSDPLIAPSVLAADLSNLEAASRMVLDAGAEYAAHKRSLPLVVMY